MQTKLMTVTPKLAKEWLAKNAQNRKISPMAVAEHKRNLLNKSFRTTHQGIAFDKTGNLRDGQHRLQAIVESGVSAKMLVTTGLTEEDVLAIDDGRRRSTKDMLSMVETEPVSQLTAAIAREMYIGGWHLDGEHKRRKPARLELIDFYVEHAKAIAYGTEKLRSDSAGVGLSYLGAVFARASYSVSKTKLDRFAEVFVSGLGTDELIIRIRNYILRKRREGTRAATVRDDFYSKLEVALQAWVKGESLKSINSAKTELFPLPGEEA